jgi:hypothetical protein
MPNNCPGSTRPLIPSKMTLSLPTAFVPPSGDHDPLPRDWGTTYDTSDHSTAKPPCFPPPIYAAPSLRCFLRDHHPRSSPNNARPISAPTAARPPMTPPLSELPSPPLVLLEAPLVVSITPCRTHSPKLHPVSDRPEEPNTVSNRLCWKLHDAVPLEESGSHAIVRSPLSPSIVLVRFRLPPPQKVAPGRHVHWRLEHDQVAPFELETLCVHPLASQ